MNATDQAANGTSFYTASKVDAPERPSLKADLDVDVCVIGAGFAGLTAARELARRGRSVAVLEARQIAWGASGRNTGFVLPGFAEDVDEIISRVGLDHAKALWALSEAGVAYVRDTIRDTGMPGTEPRPGWLHVSKTDKADDALSLIQRLARDFGADVEGWPVERVRAALHSTHYFHAVHYREAFHIHPLNYALGLARAAEDAGVHIFENTPAQSIDPAGLRKRIVTPAARVRAGQVVLAANTAIGKLMPRIGATVLPVTTYVITTAPLGARLREAIAYAGAVSDTDFADNHYRVVGEDQLMWAGRITTWEADPRRFVAGLKDDIRTVYPQLGEVEIQHAWAGTLGRTVHRMPQIGELSPGLWLAAGFGGHGLNTTAIGGELIARAIAEGDDTWRLFLPFELIWAGGTLGRAAAQIFYWSRSKRERIEARRARERETARGGAALAAAADPVVAQAEAVSPAPEEPARTAPV